MLLPCEVMMLRGQWISRIGTVPRGLLWGKFKRSGAVSVMGGLLRLAAGTSNLHPAARLGSSFNARNARSFLCR